MAAAKKPAKKANNQMSVGKWKISWKNFFIALSVAANIGFVVFVIAAMGTHVLDGVFMNEGLTRYCASENNDKFKNATPKVNALRSYTCASGDAKQYFDEGFQKYLDAKDIPS